MALAEGHPNMDKQTLARIEATARDNYGEYKQGCKEVGRKPMTLKEYIALIQAKVAAQAQEQK